MSVPPVRTDLRPARPVDVERANRPSPGRQTGEFEATAQALGRIETQQRSSASRFQSWMRHPDERVVDAALRSRSFRALSRSEQHQAIRTAVARALSDARRDDALWTRVLDTALQVAHWHDVRSHDWRQRVDDAAAKVASWASVEPPGAAATALETFQALPLWRAVAVTDGALDPPLVAVLFAACPSAAVFLPANPRFRDLESTIWEAATLSLDERPDAMPLLDSASRAGYAPPDPALDAAFQWADKSRLFTVDVARCLVHPVAQRNTTWQARWLSAVDRGAVIEGIRSGALDGPFLDRVVDHHPIRGEIRDALMASDRALARPHVREALSRSAVPAVAKAVLRAAQGAEARPAFRTLMRAQPRLALQLLHERPDFFPTVLSRRDVTALIHRLAAADRPAAFAFLGRWPAEPHHASTLAADDAAR